MKYELVLSGVPEADLSRRVLAYDLCRLKNHVKELNQEAVQELDTYFEVICTMARMDSAIFKSFFRRLIRRK